MGAVDRSELGSAPWSGFRVNADDTPRDLDFGARSFEAEEAAWDEDVEPGRYAEPEPDRYTVDPFAPEFDPEFSAEDAAAASFPGGSTAPRRRWLWPAAAVGLALVGGAAAGLVLPNWNLDPGRRPPLVGPPATRPAAPTLGAGGVSPVERLEVARQDAPVEPPPPLEPAPRVAAPPARPTATRPEPRAVAHRFAWTTSRTVKGRSAAASEPVGAPARPEIAVASADPAPVPPPAAWTERAAPTTMERGSPDCGDANSLAQAMVCADPRLAAADRRLARAYDRALESGVPRRQLRSDQNDWLAIREDAAHVSRRAMASIYRQRIEELEALVPPDPD